MHIFKVCNLMSLIYAYTCEAVSASRQWTRPAPRKVLSRPWHPSLPLIPSPEASVLLSVSLRYFALSRMAYERNRAARSLWHLDSFTQHNGLEVHPGGLSVDSSHLFIVGKYSMVCSSLPLKVKFGVISGLVWLLINKATVRIRIPGLLWTPAFISLR